ncbi:MAG: hypothetical protein F6K30_11475 [Cyanothece sp. SIO2G6]|nr:hypothetical protein [Cyanothece sp. SIO2G6]
MNATGWTGESPPKFNALDLSDRHLTDQLKTEKLHPTSPGYTRLIADAVQGPAY